MTPIEGAPAASGVRAPLPEPEKNAQAGVVAALITYGLWGILPVFFKLLVHLDPLAVVANRVIFSLILVAVLVYFRGQMAEVWSAIRDRRVLMAMAISSVLIAANWLTFIWSVLSERVLEASFGYFINPLMSVALGMVLLGERMNRMQWVAISIALVAVVIQALDLGTIPWISLLLAMSFALYGYVRKTAGVGSAPGLMIETSVLVPVSLAYMAFVLLGPSPDFYSDPMTNFWLVMTGPATAIPLVLFAFAARQLRLSVVGMFQYIAPSIQFLCAVLLFGEALSTTRLVSFALIWVSLIIFTYDAVSRVRRLA